MWRAVWYSATVVCVLASSAASVPVPDSLYNLTPFDVVHSYYDMTHDRNPGYDSPAMSQSWHYTNGRSAGAAAAGGGMPWFPFLSLLPRDIQGASERVKRRMPSLSIDLPMSVLRQKLSLEKERKVKALRAAVNRNFLNDIGKRGFE